MIPLWHKITAIGLNDDLSFSDKKRVSIINRFSLIFSLIVLLYVFYDLQFLPTKSGTDLTVFLIVHLTGSLIFVPVLLFNHLEKYSTARFFTFFVLYIVIFINSYYRAEPFRLDAYFLILSLLSFIIFKKMIHIIPINILVGISYYLIASHIIAENETLLNISIGLESRVVVLFTLLFMINYFITKENESYHNKLEDANHQLTQSHENLAKSNFTKDKILSIISHDLRSPINSLQGMLSLFRSGNLDKDTAVEYAKKLEDQVIQLTNTLDELLTWSSSNLQGIKVDPETVALRPLVQDILAISKIRARAKGIILTSSIPQEIGVYCDKNMLNSIITNIISNAIKFTPKGGAISVAAEQTGEFVKINIEDTGIGISKENIDKMMNSMHFTTRGTDNEKGTGLGVAMSKDFIEKNNGKLEILSEVNKGSSFQFSLPAINLTHEYAEKREMKNLT